jgi:hypothetical protein
MRTLAVVTMGFLSTVCGVADSRSRRSQFGLRSSGAGELHLIVDSTGLKLPVNHRRMSDLGIKIRPPLLKDQRHQDGLTGPALGQV